VDKREDRIEEIACVIHILSNGTQVYVVARAENHELVWGTVNEKGRVQWAEKETVDKLRSRVAFKRATLKLPRRTEIKLFNFTILNGEIAAVFQADADVFVASSKAVERWVLGDELSQEFAMANDGKLYRFSRGKTDWMRLTENPADGTSVLMGHERPLAKDWTEAGPLDWAVRNPRFLTAVPDGVVVTDRTPHAFTEASAISWFSKKENRFFRVDAADQDVGGIFYALDGLLISKPRQGSVVWYGKKSPFSKEERK
jgi:hypothetical protein